MAKGHAVVRALDNKERESIKIKAGDVTNKTLLLALDALMRCPFDQEVCYRLSKIIRRLQQIADTYRDTCKNIILKHAEKDEKGDAVRVFEPMVNAEGAPELDKDGVQKQIPVDYKWLDEGKQEAEKEFKAAYSEEFPIDCYKLSRLEVFGAKLTTAQWMALEPLLADPPKMDEGI